jgi:hypothetical protein
MYVVLEQEPSRRADDDASGFLYGLGRFWSGQAQDDSDSDQGDGCDDPTKHRRQIGQPQRQRHGHEDDHNRFDFDVRANTAELLPVFKNRSEESRCEQPAVQTWRRAGQEITRQQQEGRRKNKPANVMNTMRFGPATGCGSESGELS